MALPGVLTAQTALFGAGILHTKQHRILRLWEQVSVATEQPSHHTIIVNVGWWCGRRSLGREQADVQVSGSPWQDSEGSSKQTSWVNMTMVSLKNH